MTPEPAAAHNPSPPRKTRFGFVVAVVVLVAVACAAFFYFRSQENRFDQDNYMRANQLYKDAFSDYQRGDMQGYRMARDKLLQAMELQARPAHVVAEGGLPVRANALTHNASALLAILSALTGDCAGFKKYSDLAARIADQEWSIDVLDEVQQQVNDEEKAKLIHSARQSMDQAGARCRDTGLPVKSFETSPGE